MSIAPAAPTAVGLDAIRRELTAALAEAGIDEDGIADVALVVCELVGNALRHGGVPAPTRTGVHWQIDAGGVLVAVDDDSPARPEPRVAPAGAVDGRGLRIIEALADRWGVTPRDRGKRVWAHVPVTVRLP